MIVRKFMQWVQTAPASGSGLCRATYTFELTAARPFVGNLGGFSETGGVWHGTLDLGVNTQANKVVATDCGPDRAFTANQFGKPPRMSIPISVTGTFNPSTAVLTIDATSLTPANGGNGARRDVLAGLLRGSG